MPLSTLVSAPGLTWDFVAYYPYPRTDDQFPLVSWGANSGRYMTGVGVKVRENEYRWANMLHSSSSLGGADYALRCPTGGIPYINMYDAAGGGRQLCALDAFHAQVDNGTGFVLAAGAEFGDATKVFWLRFLLQCPYAAPDYRNGLLMIPRNVGVHAWPDIIPGVNNSGGFGITGDGAGQWQYGSYNRAGGMGVREIVALPAHVLAEWNMVDILIISQRVGQPAEMQFWFNGALILTRNWLGVLLEAQAANEWRFLPFGAGGSVAAVAGGCNIAEICCRRGQYDSQGTAV